jgi:signal transduction histidine kinase
MRSLAYGFLVYFTVIRYLVRLLAEIILGKEVTQRFGFPYPFIFGFISISITYFYIVIPLNKMNRIMNRFKSGEFEERVPMRRNDEIGEIAETFNQLANRVQFLIQTERKMTANLGHEIRTPLTRMMLHLNNVKERVELDESVLLLENEIRNLSTIASKLLKLAQLERDEFKPQLEVINLNDFIHKIARKMQGLAKSQSCRVEVISSPNLTCQSDKDLMEMVLDNILDNAIHYSGSNSVIQIIAQSNPDLEGEHVEIVVRDQGPGVPDSEIEKIFEQYERLDSARDRKAGGSGIGLAICRTIITSLGGTIEASNLNPGFEVRILLHRHES